MKWGRKSSSRWGASCTADLFSPAEQDHEILIFILDHCDVKVPYQELADHLGCTPKALTHRIANLKKAVKEQRQNGGANNSGNDDATTAPTTPVTSKKRTRTAAAGKGKAGKAAKKAKVEVESDNEDDSVDPASHADGHADGGDDSLGADMGEF